MVASYCLLTDIGRGQNEWHPTSEGHVRRYFGGVKGAAEMGIQKAWRGRGRGGGGGYLQRLVRDRHGSIGILVWRQVTPVWVDDTVRIKYGCWWRGYWVRRGLPPPGKTSDGGRGGKGGSRIAMQK